MTCNKFELKLSKNKDEIYFQTKNAEQVLSLVI